MNVFSSIFLQHFKVALFKVSILNETDFGDFLMKRWLDDPIYFSFKERQLSLSLFAAYEALHSGTFTTWMPYFLISISYVLAFFWSFGKLYT